MTEKQIYNRLNRCYMNVLEGDVYEFTDEWYGDDDLYIWVFYRPSAKETFKMVLDTETKSIRVERFKGDTPWFDSENAFRKITFKNGDY